MWWASPRPTQIEKEMQGDIQNMAPVERVLSCSQLRKSKAPIWNREPVNESVSVPQPNRGQMAVGWLSDGCRMAVEWLSDAWKVKIVSPKVMTIIHKSTITARIGATTERKASAIKSKTTPIMHPIGAGRPS